MIEVWWYMKLDKLAEKVTKPHPWVDPEGIAALGSLASARLLEMAKQAKRLQEDGWALKLDNNAVVATTDKYDSIIDASDSLTMAGVNQKECTIIMK